MKTIKIILITALMMPIALMAQKGSFDDLFEKYSNNKDVKSVMISLGAIKVNFGDNDDAGNAFNLMNQIDKINILKFDNYYKTFRNSDFFDEINAIIKKNNYKQLVDVKSNDENVGIYIIEGNDGMITEGLIIANEDDEAAIISVRGNINPADFLTLRNHVHQFPGMHHQWRSRHFKA